MTTRRCKLYKASAIRILGIGVGGDVEISKLPNFSLIYFIFRYEFAVPPTNLLRIFRALYIGPYTLFSHNFISSGPPPSHTSPEKSPRPKNRLIYFISKKDPPQASSCLMAGEVSRLLRCLGRPGNVKVNADLGTAGSPGAFRSRSRSAEVIGEAV